MTTVRFNETNAGGQCTYPGNAAFACACLDLRVFPMVSGTKRPAIAGWQELATTSPGQIQDWWCGEFSDAGVGIATGAGSNLLVIDIDVKRGINGFASLQKLCAENGADPGIFANTMTIATPSGGAHLWLRHADGVHNSAGELGEGLDVRGEGGLVCAPGWAGYSVVARNGVRGLNIMDAPDWLVELARAKPKRPVNADGSENEPNSGGHVMGTRRTLESLYATPVGSRNHELNKAAFRLAVRGELTHDDAWGQCQKVLIAMGAGDGMNDWLRTFESGWQSGIAKRG